MRFVTCTCCGQYTERPKLPHDFNLDTGYGRCERCLPVLIRDAVERGYLTSVDKIIDPDDRLEKYTEYFTSHA